MSRAFACGYLQSSRQPGAAKIDTPKLSSPTQMLVDGEQVCIASSCLHSGNAAAIACNWRVV
ncbi:MAG: hypothetical protein IGS48_16940 [Oscillatoriales cyanobacterium C42_A2020_001]|nr:hypothetical protein [Leptolyngbyaceae cyanobacterium C42_A2020_001]